MGLAGSDCSMGELDLVEVWSSGGSMLMGAWLLTLKLGCWGSVRSQYPIPRRLTMGMAVLAHVQNYVVLVSLCLNNLYHWLLINSTGSYSLLGEYFLGMK